MLVPSKYIKTQAESLNVLPAFIYVEREPDFVLAASVLGANLATELCCQQQVYLILMDVQTENRENGLILNYSPPAIWTLTKVGASSGEPTRTASRSAMIRRATNIRIILISPSR